MFEEIISRFPGQVIEVGVDGIILQHVRNICQNMDHVEMGGLTLTDLWGEEPDFYQQARETRQAHYGQYTCKCLHNVHSFIFAAIPYGEEKERILLIGVPLLNEDDQMILKQREIAQLFVQQFMDIEHGVLTMNDEQGRYFYVNETALKVIGMPREEVIGKRVGFYRSDFKPLINKAMEKRDIATNVVDYVVDGERKYYHLTALPILKEDRLIAGVTIGTDITERVLLEKKLIDADRMYMIGEMAARIMHDIRNPLQIVKTSAQLLSLWNDKDTMEPTKVTAMLNNINTAVNNVVDLMNDMLQFSKPSCDEKYEVNLADLLYRLSNLLSSTMEKHKIQFTLDVEEECGILGDEKLIRQGILNIVQNAIDVLHDLDGERRLEIRCRMAGEQVLLEIYNSGPIIEERVREKIFDTFFSTKGKEGTGLGLAITKEIVERLHDGQIWCVSSKQNGGTSFVIQLPIHTVVTKASRSI